MAMDDAERASLIAAWRAAQSAPTDRRDRVLARLLSPGDYAALLPEEPIVRRWPLVLLAVAAAVLAVLALELTGEITARLGRVGRFEAADSDARVRAAQVAGEAASARATSPASTRTASRVPVAELPEIPAPAAMLPMPEPLVPVPAFTSEGVPIQRPRVAGVVVPPPTATAPAEVEPPVDPEVREAEYISLARAALARRAWVDVSNVLDRHLAEFPHGKHALDRSAMRIIVACRIEPGTDTRTAARDFIVRHARSTYTPQIIGACRSDLAITSPFEE